MRLFFKYLSFTVFLLIVVPSTQANSLRDVQALLDEGEFVKAEKILRDLLVANPQSDNVRFKLGVTLSELNKNTEAIELFKQVIASHPNWPEPHNNLAVLYATQGKFEDARDALENAIKTHPSYGTAYENLGDVYAAMAATAYQKALDLNDSNADTKRKLDIVRLPLDFTQEEIKTAAVESNESVATTITSSSAIELPEPNKGRVPQVNDQRTTSEKVVIAKNTAGNSAATIDALNNAQLELDATVKSALDKWASAWSSQDIAKYLDAYIKGYQPNRTTSNAAWRQIRLKRLTKPKFIDVKLEDIKINVTGTDQVRVVFRQKYSSDTYSDAVVKNLDLIKTNNGWKITREF